MICPRFTINFMHKCHLVTIMVVYQVTFFTKSVVGKVWCPKKGLKISYIWQTILEFFRPFFGYQTCPTISDTHTVFNFMPYQIFGKNGTEAPVSIPRSSKDIIYYNCDRLGINISRDLSKNSYENWPISEVKFLFE